MKKLIAKLYFVLLVGIVIRQLYVHGQLMVFVIVLAFAGSFVWAVHVVTET